MLYQSHKKNMAAGIRWSIVLTLALIIWYALVKPTPTQSLYFSTFEGETIGLIHLPGYNQWLDIPAAFVMIMTIWTLASLSIGITLTLDSSYSSKGCKGFFLAIFILLFVVGIGSFFSYNELLWLIGLNCFVLFFAIDFIVEGEPGISLITGLGSWAGISLAYCLKNGFVVGFAASLIAVMPFFILIFFLYSLYLGVRFGLIPSVKPKSLFAWLNANDLKAPDATERRKTKTIGTVLGQDTTEAPPNLEPDTTAETVIG